jgi:hypothetical protein
MLYKNIILNLILLGKYFNFNFRFILKLIVNSITRDNASSNDTLIKGFIRHYKLNNIAFIGNISCLAHILNLVV